MATTFGADPKDLLRPVPVNIFGRKKAGIALTDNLVGRVALDTFGTGVPTHHPARRVQHENGVVLDTIEEHSEILLAVPEGFVAGEVIAMETPAARRGNHQAEDNAKNQRVPGLAQVSFRGGIAQ